MHIAVAMESPKCDVPNPGPGQYTVKLRNFRNGVASDATETKVIISKFETMMTVFLILKICHYDVMKNSMLK